MVGNSQQQEDEVVSHTILGWEAKSNEYGVFTILSLPPSVYMYVSGAHACMCMCMCVSGVCKVIGSKSQMH